MAIVIPAISMSVYVRKCVCDQQTNNVTPTNMFAIMYASYFQIQLRDDTHMEYTETVNTEQILP